MEYTKLQSSYVTKCTCSKVYNNTIYNNKFITGLKKPNVLQ
jgi:hypothetical protein